MTAAMRFGLPGGRGAPGARGATSVLGIARRADELGFDHLWFGEGYLGGQPPATRGNSGPLVLAAAVAAVTTRIRLGVSPLLVGLHDPLRLAADIAALDVLSGGRVTVGAGWPQDWYAHAVATVAGGSPGESVFGEPASGVSGIEVVVGRLDDMTWYWQGNPTGGGYRIHPLPMQRPHPPVRIAPHTVTAIEWAAGRGYGIVVSALQTRERLGACLARFRDHGGQLADAPVERFCLVAGSDAEARRLAWPAVQELTRRLRQYGTGDYAYRTLADPELDPELFYRETAVVGGPQTVLQLLTELRDSHGVRQVALRPSFSATVPLAVQQATVELFGREVMPLLTRSSGAVAQPPAAIA